MPCSFPRTLQAKEVELLFKAQKQFLHLASQCTKPPADKLPSLLAPMVTHLTTVGELKDANRKSAQFNHLSTVAEGIPAAGWVAVVRRSLAVDEKLPELTPSMAAACVNPPPHRSRSLRPTSRT